MQILHSYFWNCRALITRQICTNAFSLWICKCFIAPNKSNICVTFLVSASKCLIWLMPKVIWYLFFQHGWNNLWNYTVQEISQSVCVVGICFWDLMLCHIIHSVAWIFKEKKTKANITVKDCAPCWGPFYSLLLHFIHSQLLPASAGKHPQ